MLIVFLLPTSHDWVRWRLYQVTAAVASLLESWFLLSRVQCNTVFILVLCRILLLVPLAPCLFYVFFVRSPPLFLIGWLQGRVDQALVANGGEGEEGLGHLLVREVGHLPVGVETWTAVCRCYGINRARTPARCVADFTYSSCSKAVVREGRSMHTPGQLAGQG